MMTENTEPKDAYVSVIITIGDSIYDRDEISIARHFQIPEDTLNRLSIMLVADDLYHKAISDYRLALAAEQAEKAAQETTEDAQS